MKITKEQLRKLIREAIREQLATEDFYPGKYGSPGDIVDRYSSLVMRQLNVDDHKLRIGVVNAFTSAVGDAVEYGKTSNPPEAGATMPSADKSIAQ